MRRYLAVPWMKERAGVVSVNPSADPCIQPGMMANRQLTGQGNDLPQTILLNPYNPVVSRDVRTV